MRYFAYTIIGGLVGLLTGIFFGIVFDSFYTKKSILEKKQTIQAVLFGGIGLIGGAAIGFKIAAEIEDEILKKKEYTKSLVDTSFFKKNRHKESYISQSERNSNTSIENYFDELRESGQNNKRDEVFEAWISDNLERMLKVTSLKTNLVNRHFLLQSIVEKTYKLRAQETYKDLCLEYAKIHISEFNNIESALKKDMNGVLPRVSTFQHYATLLTEIGEYEKAISVCRKAIEYGLNDGTKSNYEGRIERIKKRCRPDPSNISATIERIAHER